MATIRARKPLSASPVSSRPVQLNLTGITRADKKAKPPRRLESVLQAQSLKTLALMGYAGLEVGQGRKKIKVDCVCPRCSNKFEQWTYPTGYVGNDIGTPDTFMFRYSGGWPLGAMIG